MSRIAGVQFEKDARGNKRYVRIDLKKHAATMAPVLKQLGALQAGDDDFDAEFEKEWGTGLTGDQLRANLHEFIKTLPWDK